MAENFPASTLLEARQADVCAAGNPAALRVRDVNWNVQPGEYWVVGGPPECGKTDLLATAAGLQRPARGSIRLFGKELSELPERELLRQRTRIGFVFKNGGRLFAQLTVAESVSLPLRYHHDPDLAELESIVNAVLVATDLADAAKLRPSELGPSILQRVSLARALSLRPEILFVDEALTGLGWRQRQWWLDMFDKLAAGVDFLSGKKLAVVVTANDLSPWSGRHPKFAVVKEGRWEILGEQAEPPML